MYNLELTFWMKPKKSTDNTIILISITSSLWSLSYGMVHCQSGMKSLYYMSGLKIKCFITGICFKV